ncbi:MAG: CRISPR-associated protein Cas4 [Christensenellales bacterium]|jgi:CRISPR-associated exonuclease Cas4
MSYSEDEYLLLSGIQHFVFCRRQWALIHIEQKWEENLRTVEGNRMHMKAHNGPMFERRGDLLAVRGLTISSSSLGLSGTCDVVEFWCDSEGISLFGQKGRYHPIPIEYKRGEPKTDLSDSLQLCAQAACLEEMLSCTIPKGYLYYGETRHRLEVEFNTQLRMELNHVALEMHELYRRHYTPKVHTGRFCRACSLVDQCLPKLCRIQPVSQYIADSLKGGDA